MGIKVTDLIKCRLVDHKNQAQLLVKYGVRKGVLFTLGKHRPQIYYPTSQKSEITKNYLAKNTPKEVTGVCHNPSLSVLDSESLIIQSLEGYVLPLMPVAPSYIHKLHLKTKLTPKCYQDLACKCHDGNKAKRATEIIGNNQVTYLFYPNGTVMVSTENRNNPFKLETEYDRVDLLTFFGQVRDRLIFIISDIHERLVSKILEWELIQCDINKDVCVNDWLQFTGFKIQYKHLDRVFRVYIKSMGKNTVCRVEESKNPKKPVVEAINEILNPDEVTKELLRSYKRELSEIKCILSEIKERLTPGSELQ